MFLFLLLRWTGPRVSDAVKLLWDNILFDRGTNGEIEMLTQKRGKAAIDRASQRSERPCTESANRTVKIGFCSIQRLASPFPAEFG